GAITLWVQCGGLALYAAVHRELRLHRIGAALLRPNWREAIAIVRLGWPITGIYAMETGTFSATGLLAGLLGTGALAAHQVAMSVTSLTFMVPLAFSHAATVRVALAAGAGQMVAARRVGTVAFACGVGFMVVTALVLVIAPGGIVALYLDRS